MAVRSQISLVRPVNVISKISTAYPAFEISVATRALIVLAAVPLMIPDAAVGDA